MDDCTLHDFIDNEFDFDGLLDIGFFDESHRGDYEKQADRICKYFGLNSIYEYRSKTTIAHVTYATPESGGFEAYRPLHVNSDGELKEEPFFSVIRPWWDD